MKNINFFFLLTFIFTFTYNCYCNVLPKKGSNYYVYVQSVEGGKSNPEFNNHIQSYIDQFNKVIAANLNTYENQSELEQVQKCTYGYTVSEEDVFSVYLNENIIDKIEAIPGVLEVEAPIKMVNNDPIVPKENVTPKAGSNYYVYVQSVEGGKSNPEFNDHIQSYIDQFNKVIAAYLNTYENQSELEQIQKCTYGYTVSEEDVFSVYLNENIIDKVEAIPGVLEVEAPIKMVNDNSKAPVENDDEYVKCEEKQKQLGYSCCKKENTKVYYNDEDGDWGFDFEKNEWCGLASTKTAVIPKKGGNYYIYVKSVKGGKSNPEFNKHIQSYIDQFGEIIIANLDSYENKPDLEQFQNEFAPIDDDKINEIHKYSKCTYAYTVSGEDVFMVYLNGNILGLVEALPGVLGVESPIKFNYQ